MNENLKREIESCTTKKELLAVLKKHGIRNPSPDSSGSGYWLSELVRVYKPYKQKFYKVQRWQKVKLEYSGTPTFFATDSFF